VQPHVVLKGWWETWAKVIILADHSAQQTGDPAMQAWVLHERGTRAGLVGDLATAQADLSQAYERRLRLGDQGGAAATLRNMEHLGLLPPPPPPGEPRRPAAGPAPRLLLLALPLIIAAALVLSVASGAITAGSPDATPVAVENRPTPTVREESPAPAPADDAFDATEDQLLPIPVARLLANDLPSGDDRLRLVSVGATRLQASALRLEKDRIFYTPPANYSGPDGFSYTVADGQGRSAAASVLISVRPINDPPRAADDQVGTVEGQTLLIGAETLLANDADLDGGPLTITAVSQANSAGASVSLSDGGVVYQPGATLSSTDSFSYTLSDGRGGSAWARVAVTIEFVNEAPVASPDGFETARNDALTIPVAALLQNDLDGDGDPLRLIEIASQSLRGGSVALGAGLVTYLPPRDFTGDDGFGYLISDGQGASARGEVRVTVSDDNRAPRPESDAVRGSASRPLTLAVELLLQNDRDEDGDPLTVAAVDPRSAQGGAVTLEGGVVIYTPPPRDGESSPIRADSFGYAVEDIFGAKASAMVSVSFGSAPLAVDDALPPSNRRVAFTAEALLENDSDPDGGPLTVLEISVRSAQGGAVRALEGGYEYTPPTPAFVGTDSFSYVIGDADGETASATVTVTITNESPNTDPLAQDDQVVVDAGGETMLSIDELLANDKDPDGDSLTVVAADRQTRQGGAVSLGPNGLLYTPPAAEGTFEGTDEFTYTIGDGRGGEARARVQVFVVRPPE
jgi:hypothetical protein